MLEMLYKQLLILICFITVIPDVVSQDTIKISEGYVMAAIVVDGDTLPYRTLPKVIVTGKRTFKNKKKARRYTRLVRNVKIVYPYSKIAGQLLRKYKDTLASIESKRERKKLMKKCEQELWDRFGNELKALTMTQGMILLKLLDRETGATGYALVKDLRNGFTAFFLQSIARLFHLNLKSQYDADEEDRMIEDIVLLIERGEI